MICQTPNRFLCKALQLIPRLKKILKFLSMKYKLVICTFFPPLSSRSNPKMLCFCVHGCLQFSECIVFSFTYKYKHFFRLQKKALARVQALTSSQYLNHVYSQTNSAISSLAFLNTGLTPGFRPIIVYKQAVSHLSARKQPQNSLHYGSSPDILGYVIQMVLVSMKDIF